MSEQLQDSSAPLVESIAIIGMAGQFPDAPSIEQFWQNLCAGREALRPFSDEELLQAGIDPNRLADPTYVKAGGVLEDITQFDATYFGYSPREAEVIDPQQRLFLECAVEALNHAGYQSETYEGLIGVFAGASVNTYWHAIADRELVQSLGSLKFHSTLFGNGIDYLATRVSYKLNLRGPSVNIQTACSTSLVTVHLACQSLLTYQCDIALAGGVAVRVPHISGYYYEEGGLVSPDGHCRAFDDQAQGTVFGNGVGIVVLKRLSEALADGDNVIAVIKGSAVNNDGSNKPGYTAPGVEGQTLAIAEALAVARVSPETIGYVEAHGTGTMLGDPLEVMALTNAFRGGTDAKNYCALGSVKTNIGHLDAAAGIAGLIKTALILQRGQIPPSLNFQKPNPRIDFVNSPFFVNNKLTSWESRPYPRRAGVSSFGVGGTNAHIVLEQAPTREQSSASRPWQIVTLSAKTPSALEQATTDMAAYLEHHLEIPLADIAYTMATGRPSWRYKAMFLAQDGRKGAEILRQDTAGHFFTAQAPRQQPSILFLFPGQGTQYVHMASGLYQTEPHFRAQIDNCAQILLPSLHLDIRALLFPAPEKLAEAEQRINETEFTQPILFAVEYALASLWQSWGVQPAAMIGHSIGEYVAACLAHVLSLEDALHLVAARGRLMQKMMPGMMLAIRLSEVETRAVLLPGVELAAVNSLTLCLVAGSCEAVEEQAKQLESQNIIYHRLHTSHAFHSSMMEPMLEEFHAEFAAIKLNPPALPWLSNVTGTWVTKEQAISPDYWVQHVRQPVLFEAGIATVIKEADWLLLEVGPGQSLATLARQHSQRKDGQIVLTSLRHPREQQEDLLFLLRTLGQLWLHGVSVNWLAYFQEERRQRLPLPAYPFDRKRHWMPDTLNSSMLRSESSSATNTQLLPYPLLQQKCEDSPPLLRFTARLAANTPAYLADHRITGVTVFPATAYLEMALEAGRTLKPLGNLTLAKVHLQEALVLQPETVSIFQIVVAPTTPEEQSFAIYSVAEGEEQQQKAWTLHVTGSLLESEQGSVSPVNPLQEIQDRCKEEINGEAFYQLLAPLGYHYGPAFQGVQQVWRRDGEALGRLEHLAAGEEQENNYQVYPPLLDACLQVVAAALPETYRENIFLPVGCKRVQVSGRATATCWSHVTFQPDDDEQMVCADIQLFNEAGEVVIEIQGLTSLKMNRLSARTGRRAEWQDWLYTMNWQELAEKDLPVRSNRFDYQTWLILADRGEVGQKLAADLRVRGAICVLVRIADRYEMVAPGEYTIDPADPTHIYQLLREVNSPEWPPCKGIIHLWNLDLLPPEQTPAQTLTESIECGYLSVVYLVQALVRVQTADSPHLWIITRAAQAVFPEQKAMNIGQAPVWGLGRVITLEQPELACTCFDLDPEASDQDSSQVLTALSWETGENQIAFRAGVCYLARLVREPLTQRILNAQCINQSSDSCYLVATEPGTLHSLTLQTAGRIAPEQDQVEIKVMAAGLNFADLLKALGLYPGAEGSVPLGGECAGVVTRVGKDVVGLQSGDAVVAIAPGSLGAYVTTLASLVVHKPAKLSFEDAATVPITFLTGFYSLYQVARLQHGERVLIHAGSGGVGLAAIQLARRVGAEIYATAGTPAKRHFLSELGIKYVFDSQTTDFAQEILQQTSGEGVDVVLNSLSGEAIPQGLAILRPFGRFLDISKTDIYKNSPVGLSPFRRSLSYTAIDLDQLFRTRPAQIREALREILELMEKGELTPLPRENYPLEHAYQAFFRMTQREHIGKIVLDIRQEEPGITRQTFSSNGTYLLSGGSGALGIQVASWLADAGARHLLLLARHAPSPEAEQHLQGLRQSGCEIVVAQVDVAQRQELAAVIEHMQQNMPPLRGVMHLAGQIDDDRLLSLDARRFASVLAPKIDGSWNLHLLTKELPLDFFVLFSSVSSLLGMIGQGNYATANAFLDALAWQRHVLQTPALSINWGPWSEAGMATRSASMRALQRLGMALIAPEQGLQALHYFIQQTQLRQIAVLPYHPAQTLQRYAPETLLPVLSALDVATRGQETREHTQPYTAFQARPILSVEYTAPEGELEQIVAGIWQKTLGIEQIGTHDDFFELGGTSLLAPQILNELRRAFPLEFTLQQLFEAPTVAQIAQLVQQLLIEKLEKLSEEEAHTLLER